MSTIESVTVRYTFFWVALTALTYICSSGPSYQSKMTDRTPWWKAFLPKRKSGGKDFEPDFNPFAQQQEKQKEPTAAASKTPGNHNSSQQESSKSNSLLSDETFDDSHLESVFNEQTCRRNMKVSRSGRFKEKRRVRSTLPIEEKETEKAVPGKEDIR